MSRDRKVGRSNMSELSKKSKGQTWASHTPERAKGAKVRVGKSENVAFLVVRKHITYVYIYIYHIYTYLEPK